MLYQLGIILIFVVAALIFAKRINDKKNNSLIYEDEMDKDELRKIDEELINYLAHPQEIYRNVYKQILR